MCLSLADLALQMGEEWTDVIPSMIDAFGKDQEGIPMLLEFLKVLVEESENTRIPLTVGGDEEQNRLWQESQSHCSTYGNHAISQSEQAGQRFEVILTSQSDRVLELLSMYMQAPGGVGLAHSFQGRIINPRSYSTLNRSNTSHPHGLLRDPPLMVGDR